MQLPNLYDWRYKLLAKTPGWEHASHRLDGTRLLHSSLGRV